MRIQVACYCFCWSLVASPFVYAEQAVPSPSPSIAIEDESLANELPVMDGYGITPGSLSRKIIDPEGVIQRADQFINDTIKSEAHLRTVLHATIEHIQSHQLEYQGEVWEYLTHSIRWRLQNLPNDSDRHVILTELDSGKDFSVREPFLIGAKGRVDFAPSYRVALLDFLRDLLNPEVLAYARRVFRSTKSDQERLVALAIIVEAQGDKGLQEGVVLANSIFKDSSWQEKPVTIFAEAFDVYVAAHAYNEIPFLLSLQRSDVNREHRWPAYLALYRLVERDPARAAKEIVAHFELMNDFPELRGDLFSLVVPNSDSARQVLEEYLSIASLSEIELDKFFSLLPNHNRFHSDSLFSEDLEGWRDSYARAPVVEQAEIQEESRSVVAWLRDVEHNPDFSSHKSQVQIARERLEEDVQAMEEERLLFDTRLSSPVDDR